MQTHFEEKITFFGRVGAKTNPRRTLYQFLCSVKGENYESELRYWLCKPTKMLKMEKMLWVYGCGVGCVLPAYCEICENFEIFQTFDIIHTGIHHFHNFHNLHWVLASPSLCPYICTIFTVFTIYTGISKAPTLFSPALIFFNIFTTSKKLHRGLCSTTFVTFAASISPREISINKSS